MKGWFGGGRGGVVEGKNSGAGVGPRVKQFSWAWRPRWVGFHIKVMVGKENPVVGHVDQIGGHGRQDDGKPQLRVYVSFVEAVRMDRLVVVSR